MKTHRFILCLFALLAASCASDSGGQKSSTAPSRKSLGERLDENNGYKQDADGNWLPKSDKRSSFETKGESPYFQGKLGKKSYKTGEFAKKSWWGNKDYGSKQYAGNTDGGRFQNNSRFNGKGARESGNAADLPGAYQTDDYATNAARETGKTNLTKPSNAEIDKRREVFEQPEMIDWREQRSLSLDQSRGILGR